MDYFLLNRVFAHLHGNPICLNIFHKNHDLYGNLEIIVHILKSCRKKIIALAVAGLVSSVAFAQSNVTVYGRMDAGFSSVSGGAKGNQRVTGVYTGGLTTPRIGFKGEEALGNGLKAVFTLESAVSNDKNRDMYGVKQDTFWGNTRYANVGLSGSFGTVRIGVVGTPTDDWNGNEGETGSLGNISARSFAGDLKGGFAGTKDQGIQYVSPNFSGLTLGAAVIFANEGNKWNAANVRVDSRDTLYNFGATYNNGPIKGTFTYGYEKQDAVTGLKKNKQQYALGLGYNFGVATVQGSYEHVDNAGYVKTDADNELYTLAVIVPVGSGKVSFGYAMQNNDAKKSDGQGMVLGYEHSLSKRTTAYGAFFRGTNDTNSANTAPGRFGNLAGGADRNFNGFAVGMRHDF